MQTPLICALASFGFDHLIILKHELMFMYQGLLLSYLLSEATEQMSYIIY